jgi:hypothetical protein
MCLYPDREFKIIISLKRWCEGVGIRLNIQSEPVMLISFTSLKSKQNMAPLLDLITLTLSLLF